MNELWRGPHLGHLVAGALARHRDEPVLELGDTTLTQATYYFGWYVFEALRQAGLGEQYVERLAPWREMLALGLT